MSANAGFIGGDASGLTRYAMVQKYLTNRPAVDLGWRYQCRCGQARWTWWRKRWYCVTCGRWVKKFPSGNLPLDERAHDAYTVMLLAGKP